jgi:predicted kinase
LLELGEPVILDASWSAAEWREKARAVARATSSDLLELRCDAPVGVTRERLAARARAGLDASDATSEIAARMASTATPWPTATTVDTSAGREDALTAAVAAADQGSSSGL